MKLLLTLILVLFSLKNEYNCLNIRGVSETNVNATKNTAKRASDGNGEFYPDWVPFKNKKGDELGDFVQVPKAKVKKRLALPLNFVLKAVAEPQDDYYEKGGGGGGDHNNEDYYEKKEWSDVFRDANDGAKKVINHKDLSDIDGVVDIITSGKHLIVHNNDKKDNGKFDVVQQSEKKPGKSKKNAIDDYNDAREIESGELEQSNIKRLQLSRKIADQSSVVTPRTSTESNLDDDEVKKPVLKDMDRRQKHEIEEQKLIDDQFKYNEKKLTDKKDDKIDDDDDEDKAAELKKSHILDGVDDLRMRHENEQKDIAAKNREEQVFAEEFLRDKIFKPVHHDKYKSNRYKRPKKPSNNDDESGAVLNFDKYQVRTTSTPAPLKSKYAKLVEDDYDEKNYDSLVSTEKTKHKSLSSKNKKSSKYKANKNDNKHIKHIRKPLRRVKTTTERFHVKSSENPSETIEDTSGADSIVSVTQTSTHTQSTEVTTTPKIIKLTSTRKFSPAPESTEPTAPSSPEITSAETSSIETTRITSPSSPDITLSYETTETDSSITQPTAENTITSAAHTEPNAPETMTGPDSEVSSETDKKVSSVPDSTESDIYDDSYSNPDAERVRNVRLATMRQSQKPPADAEVASSDVKKEDHKKDDHGGDHSYEKGGEKEYHSQGHEEHGEHGKKAYEGHHKETKNKKGHHDKESHEGTYHDAGGHDRHHHDEKAHYGHHHHEEDGKKHAKYEESGKHSKGHSTKGSHDIHKKDEYEKKVEFFEEDGDDDFSENGGGHHSDFGHEKGGHTKHSNLKADHSSGVKGGAGHFAKGGEHHQNKGHKSAGGHDSHGKYQRAHQANEGKSGGKKWVYHQGSPAKTANLVVIDRRRDAYQPFVMYG